ncbi:hypothetical protein ACHMW5_13795 [Azospirillum melinis]|uniref:hypothetical protein n=1 Tax=Azospirillum melinis TaxID=328839 RepID=UPI003757B8EA
MADAKPTYYFEVQAGYALTSPVPVFFKEGDVISFGEEGGDLVAYRNGVKMGPASPGPTDAERAALKGEAQP